MAFLGGGSADTATTVLELAGLGGYASGQRLITNNWVDAAEAQDAYSQSAARMSNAGTVLAAAGGAVATSALLMGKSFVTAAGNLQSTRAGFTSMLGGVDAAEAKIKELQNFAATTPFDFTQSAKGAQQLLAMGVAADDLVPTMRSVGNAVAAAGGNTDQFLGVLTAIGQIQTKGRLSTEEVMQMAERGIPAFQILQRELGLTQEQLGNLGNEGIEASRVIPALLRGMGSIGGGRALEEASNTFNGALSNFTDAWEQFQQTAGESLVPMATDGIRSLSRLVEAGREFAELHPGFMRNALVFATLGGAVSVLAGLYLKLRANALMTAAAKRILQGATVADTVAERAKAAVAGQEGAAIEGVGRKATETAGKLSALARVRAFAAQPLRQGLGTVGAFGRDTFAVSRGGAAVAGALGVAAGVGANDDYRTLGYSAAQSAAAGAFTGVGAAAAAMFLPGGAVAVAAAVGVRYLFNELVNRPMEREAEQGSGLQGDDEKNIGKMSNSEKSAAYFRLRDQRMAAGDDAGAGSALIMANRYRREAALDPARARESATSAWLDSQFKKAYGGRSGEAVTGGRNAAARPADQPTAGADNGAYEGDWTARARSAATGGPGGPATGAYGVDTNRNGTRRVTLDIPTDPAYDLQTRLRRHNNLKTAYGD